MSENISSMYYVYLIRSLKDSTKTYVGYTTNLTQRLEKHNAGGSVHTCKHKPWKLVTYVGFDCEQKALDFERYIKIGSGHAFAKKRFW
jgi:putative endonuclease